MKHKNKWFESWFDSPYYPVLYRNRNMEEAEFFVKKLVAFLHLKKQDKILDIACGEGRFSHQLSSYVAEVVGIDLSEKRIVQAKSFKNDKASFFIHDMRNLFYVNYFDYAFNFFTSFGYFDRLNDHLKAAKAFSAALKHEGILVVDYFNNQYVKSNLKQKETIERENIIFNISKKIEGSKIIKHIEVVEQDGRKKNYTEKVADLSVKQFEELFEKAGLKLIRLFGDYQLNDFDSHQSPRLIMLFKKDYVR